VRLYDGTGAELASTSTSGGGLYLFSGLAPGDYYVAITPPDGACSSTGTPGSATGPYEGTPGSQPPPALNRPIPTLSRPTPTITAMASAPAARRPM